MAATETRRRFKMRQRLISIGDDYDIEDDSGVRFARIDGKALRLRETLNLLDGEGKERYQVKAKLLRVRKTMTILKDGKSVATVQRALVNPLKERFSIKLSEGKDLSAKGNVLDHEYKIQDGGRTIAQVSKAWFRVRDTYGLEVNSEHDPYLLLAITVCIDSMSHEGASK